MAFTPRLTIPEKGNPYYNRKDSGGYSDAIKGKPTQTGLDVLSNCVGYAYGRFNEIVGDKGCFYLCPVNAELFIDYMNQGKKKGLTTGLNPKLGAIAVWQAGSTKQGSDGAGHVAVVEQILSNGTIVTSESGYGSSNPFWTKKRTNSNGRWGQNTNYKFLGFIYNPAVTDEPTTKRYVEGDIVYFKGGKTYTSSSAKTSTVEAIASLAKITKTYDGIHPYHCRKINEKGNFVDGGVYGWVDENSVTV